MSVFRVIQNKLLIFHKSDEDESQVVISRSNFHSIGLTVINILWSGLLEMKGH